MKIKEGGRERLLQRLRRSSDGMGDQDKLEEGPKGEAARKRHLEQISASFSKS